jgi:hypothetical protein
VAYRQAHPEIVEIDWENPQLSITSECASLKEARDGARPHVADAQFGIDILQWVPDDEDPSLMMWEFVESIAAEPADPAPKPRKQAKSRDPARLTFDWFRGEVLAICAGAFRNALITVEETGIRLQAETDKQVFVRALFPLVEGAESAGWINIKPKEFETCDARSFRVSQQAQIGNIPWNYEFDLAQVAAAVAKHKLGASDKAINATAFAEQAVTSHQYLLADVIKVLRKKPQQWRLSDKGVLGATLERDGVTYEFFLRGRGA